MPVTAKIRILPDEEQTIDLVRRIELAGAYLITVHGRTKEQKQQMTGKCDWEIIKRIKQTVKIPVIANGG